MRACASPSGRRLCSQPLALVGSTSAIGPAGPSGKKNGKIAFHSTRGGNLDIFTIGSDGTGEARLTTAAADDCCRAVWSPDGSKIAFSSERDGNGEIYVMGADGEAQTRLTRSPKIDFFPSWSPDGQRIAFSRGRGTAFDLYVMRADGSRAAEAHGRRDLSRLVAEWAKDRFRPGPWRQPVDRGGERRRHVEHGG